MSASEGEVGSAYRITLVMPSGERTIAVRPGEHIWDAAAAAGIKLPAMCHQGRCLTCAARLTGPGDFDQHDSERYLPVDREGGFLLLCTAKPRSDLRVISHQQSQMREWRLQHGFPAPYA